MAPEYYENLLKHTSMMQILTEFVVNPAMGPYARLKRKPRVAQEFYGNYQLFEYVEGVGFVQFVVRKLSEKTLYDGKL